MTARMPTREELIGTLNTLSDAFHKIAMSHEADRMLGEMRMPAKLAESIRERRLTSDQIKEICTDGFTTCVEMLVQLGAPDAAIHSCNPSPDDVP